MNVTNTYEDKKPKSNLDYPKHNSFELSPFQRDALHLLLVSKYVHINSSVVALQKKSRDCTLIYQSLCNWKLFEQDSYYTLF